MIHYSVTGVRHNYFSRLNLPRLRFAEENDVF